MTQNARTPAKGNARRNVLWGAGITLAVVLAVGAGVGFALGEEPTPPRAPAAASSAQPTPEEVGSPQPTAVTVAIPDDCQDIYTPEYFATLAVEELNHPSLAGVGISRHEDIEKIRASLPGIECIWGVPTEGGMSTAVNEITAERRIEMIAAARASGFTCEGVGENATVCDLVESSWDGDDASAVLWTNVEEVYLRDDLVVTTWWAGTRGSVDDTTQSVYDTLWP